MRFDELFLDVDFRVEPALRPDCFADDFLAVDFRVGFFEDDFFAVDFRADFFAADFVPLRRLRVFAAFFADALRFFAAVFFDLPRADPLLTVAHARRSASSSLRPFSS